MCLTVAGPFGGGMGAMGETCGAVTGALMALGVCCGQEMATDPANALSPLYARVYALAQDFRERHGSLSCRKLTGCDFRTSAGREEAKARDLHHTLCQKLVASAVELVELHQVNRSRCKSGSDAGLSCGTRDATCVRPWRTGRTRRMPPPRVYSPFARSFQGCLELRRLPPSWSGYRSSVRLDPRSARGRHTFRPECLFMAI